MITNQTNLLLAQYTVGDVVELAPHTDAWMRGDRFGKVVDIGRFYLHVKCTPSGKVRFFVPENITPRKVTP